MTDKVKLYWQRQRCCNFLAIFYVSEITVEVQPSLQEFEENCELCLEELNQNSFLPIVWQKRIATKHHIKESKNKTCEFSKK